MRFVFWGTSLFATEILEGLSAQNYLPEMIVTQTDKPVGRKKNILPSPVKIWAKKNKIPLQQWDKIDQSVISFFQKNCPDLFLVAAYGKILPKDILIIPHFGAINVHGSLLPSLRGASPIQQALLEGKKETGISLILMNEKMDAGPILKQTTLKIFPKENYSELEKRLAQLAVKILPSTIKAWTEKKIEPKIQDDKQATFCSLIKKTDGLINWQMSAEKIFNRWRAFSVWPGIFSFWKIDSQNQKRIALYPRDFSLPLQINAGKPGQVFLDQKKQLCIQTGKGFLIIDSLKLEGKKRVSAQNFLLGYPNFIGTILHS